MVFRGHFKGTFRYNWEHIISTVFFNFNFDFRVLAQKCLKPCVNGVIKFQFFFLTLYSKVLAGVWVRASKYPYMDICVHPLTYILPKSTYAPWFTSYSEYLVRNQAGAVNQEDLAVQKVKCVV